MINGIKVILFGIGEVDFDVRDIDLKKEFEFLMVFLVKKESSFLKLEGFIS